MRQTHFTAGVLAAMFAWPVLALDNIEGPYGTSHGDLYGTQRTSMVLPAGYLSDGMTLDWTFGTKAAGLSRTSYSHHLSFDAAGNMYWLTFESYAPLNAAAQYLASVDPDGNLRWATQIGATDSAWCRNTPVVGGDAVYTFGGGAVDWDGDGVAGQKLGAYNKATGAAIWELNVDGDWNNDGTAEDAVSIVPNGSGYTPALKDGKLYLVLVGPAGIGVLKVNAADGAVDWYSLVDPANTTTAPGNVVFVEGVFDGTDGIFFNMNTADTNNFGDPATLKDVYGVSVGATGAAVVWTAPGGKIARGSVTYSPERGVIMAHTWNDGGFDVIDGETSNASFVTYDVVTGVVNDWVNVGYGHGFYDVGALSADGTVLYAGGFDGKMAAYEIDASGMIVDPVATYYGPPWWGEYRCNGQLVYDSQGDPYVISATNSRTDLDPSYTARVVLIDVTQVGPAPDDAPIYIDDIEIFEGETLAQALASTAVFSEDFESSTAGDLITTLTGWADASDGEPEPTIVANPFVDSDNGSSNVLGLDALSSGTWQGATWTLPRPVGTDYEFVTEPERQIVVIRWKQYRGDLTDNMYWIPQPQNGGGQWDNSGGYMYAVGTGSSKAQLTADQWDTVELRYDFWSDSAEVYVNGVTDAGSIPDMFVADDTIGIQTLYFDLTGTDTSESFTPAVAEYDTGIDANHQPSIRGGPQMGPDGKIYGFNTLTHELIAIKPAGVGTICADANCDGAINAFDIDPFVIALVNQTQWEATYSCDYLGACDINSDGAVNAFDIDPFVVALVSGACQ